MFQIFVQLDVVIDIHNLAVNSQTDISALFASRISFCIFTLAASYTGAGLYPFPLPKPFAPVIWSTVCWVIVLARLEDSGEALFGLRRTKVVMDFSDCTYR